MRYWIKLYTEILSDPKMGRLTDRQFRTCINLFALAGEIDKDGALPPPEDMAWRFRRDEGELTQDLLALEQVGILARAAEIWQVRKWHERQAKAPSAAPERVRERVQDYRTRQRNEDVTTLQKNVTSVKRGVTPPEENREETEKNRKETETEKNRGETEVSPAWSAFVAARGININPLDSETVAEWETLYGSEAVAQAIHYCNGAKKQAFLSLNYILSVLNGWQGDGTLGLHPFTNGTGGSHPPSASEPQYRYEELPNGKVRKVVVKA